MLAGLGLAGLVHAGLGPTPPLTLKLDNLGFTGMDLCYPSGLRVTIVPDSRQPIVSVVTVIDGGQAADAPGREGTAHLLEHLWYRSVTQEDGRTEDTLDVLGATYNAQTREDVTVFEAMAPATALSRVLALEVHRFVEPLAGIDATEIDAEREVVRHELRGYIEDGSIGFSALYPRLFPGHPYATTQSDSPAGMAAVGLAELRAYAAQHYRPEGSSMHIVGAVDPQTVRSLINLTFPGELLTVEAGKPPGTCAAHAPPSTEPPEPLDTSLQRVPAPVDRPLLMVGWTLPGAWGVGEAAARQATEILEDAVYGLHREEMEGQICSYHPAVRASTVVCIRPVPHGMDADRFARKVLPWQSPSSASADPADWEPWRQSSMIENIHRILGQAEEQISPFDSGTEVALYRHFRGEPNFVLGTLDSWAAADKGVVEDVLRRYLNAKRAVPALLVPAEMQSTAISTAVRGAVGSTATGRLTGTAAGVGLPSLRDLTLENGLRVVVLPYGEMPVVRATLAFRGGRALEPEPGVNALASAVAYPLVYNRQDAVHDAWVLFGAGGSNFWRPTTQGVAYSGPSGNLDALLFLLRAATERFDLVESERTFFIENRLKWLSEVEPEVWADDVALSRVLPGHPLGRLQDAAFIEDTRLVGAAQIQHWIDAVTRPDNGTLFIVGGVDPDVAEAEVRSRLASWVDRSKPDPALPKLAPPPPPPARQVLLFPTPGDTLATVTLQCQVGPLDPAEPERADVLERLVQDAAWQALRVQNPLSYTPEATVESWEGGTTVLTVRARVRGSVAPEVAGIELDLVARLHDIQAVAAAAPVIRSELARSWPSRLATTRDMLEQLMITARLGAEWTRITEYTQRLRAFPDADLVAALDRCVDHEVVTIVGAPVPPTEAIAGVTPEAFQPGSRASTSTPSPEKGMLQVRIHGRVPR